MPGDDLVIEPTTVDTVCVLRLAGRLFLADAPRLLDDVTRALRTAPHRRVVCELSGLATPIGDVLLAAFPAALRRAGGWPRVCLRLAAARPELARQLRRLRMHRFVPVHPSLADALARADQETVTAPFELCLEADPGTLVAARTALRAIWPAVAPQGREEGVLVVNELASNAIRHVAGPFMLSLATGPGQVLAAVTDGSRAEPVLTRGRAAAGGDRGLQMVANLSLGWGVRLVHRHGKTVWARLPVGEAAPPIPRSRPAREK